MAANLVIIRRISYLSRKNFRTAPEIKLNISWNTRISP